MLTIVHLAASPFLGGPETLMLGLGQHIGPGYRSVYVSFSEGGKCRPFLNRAQELGFETMELQENTPRYRAAIREVAGVLREKEADVICCHGYKPDILGTLAGRQVKIPVVSVSHGWTGATTKVKINEAIDRVCLHFTDAVVCVSEGQARKVRRAGVPKKKIHIIRNAIDLSRFDRPDSDYRTRLLDMFPEPVTHVVGAAGRLSPEKSFAHLIDAAATVRENHPDVGFVLFGEGPLKAELNEQIQRLGLQDRFVLGGFRTDLEKWLPWFDVMAMSSLTEGLPIILLEAYAAEVPVVATKVGGIPEVIIDDENGFLVPPANPPALAARLQVLLADDGLRQDMAGRGRTRVEREFSFAANAGQYLELFAGLVKGSKKPLSNYVDSTYP